jgi:hypothetical protein
MTRNYLAKWSSPSSLSALYAFQDSSTVVRRAPRSARSLCLSPWVSSNGLTSDERRDEAKKRAMKKSLGTEQKVIPACQVPDGGISWSKQEPKSFDHFTPQWPAATQPALELRKATLYVLEPERCGWRHLWAE